MERTILRHLKATNSDPVDTPLVMVKGTEISVATTPALKQAMELGRKAGERLKQLFSKET